MRKSLFLLALAFQLAAGLFAQSAGTGSISGLVQDASGSVVPGAAVVVSNESKGIHRGIQTTSSGIFTAPALIPDANYKVTVSKSGFSILNAKAPVGHEVARIGNRAVGKRLADDGTCP